MTAVEAIEISIPVLLGEDPEDDDDDDDDDLHG